jgi:hypothetical protein
LIVCADAAHALVCVVEGPFIGLIVGVGQSGVVDGGEVGVDIVVGFGERFESGVVVVRNETN